MKAFSILILMTAFSGLLPAQQVLPLYSGEIPNSRPDSAVKEVIDSSSPEEPVLWGVTVPTLTAYFPAKDKVNGTAVIICPGGAYRVLAYKHEGSDIARRLNEWGVTAFVLKYRLPDDRIMIDKEIGPLQDAQRAIQIVREHAESWHIHSGRIGLMGFSAGAHLVATAGTHFLQSFIVNPDSISLRPDFMILAYPVISFTDSIGHIGSRDNLLGPHPSLEKIREFSAELQVTPQTPPAFIVQATDDPVVRVENSVEFYMALHQNGVPVEMHLYEKGPHGFGMHNPDSPDDWMERLYHWMESDGFLKP